MVVELIGYLSELTVLPGAALELKVSTTADEVHYDVVRLVHGDPDPRGPGLLVDVVDGRLTGSAPGREQRTQCGSFAQVAIPEGFDVPSCVTLEVLIFPTTPALGRRQVLMEVADAEQRPALSLSVDGAGRVCWTATSPTGAAQTVRCERALAPRRWYRVAGSVDGRTGELTLGLEDQREPARATRVRCALEALPSRHWDCLRIAAPTASGPVGLPRDGFFNGKIEAPRIMAGAGGLDALEAQAPILAAWDLARRIDTSTIEDVGPAGCRGELVNAPTRAVTSSRWTGEELSHRHAPEHYAAVHFHDDDLEDARWETDARIDLPDDLASGCYAVRLSAEGVVDHLPFFVSPGPASMRRRVAFLVPTFTYLAYANDRLAHDFDFEGAGLTDQPVELDEREQLLARHPELGKSLYAVHSDGSGVCFSAARRPMLTLRPDYRSALTGAPRLLGADLFITHFLETDGIEYDTITDHDLDREGAELLAPYDVVVTGSHPEYASGRMLDALETFTEGGGGLVYLGGNGFYWVTSQDSHGRGLIEVRRGAVGTRTWEGTPGEGYHSTTGEPGGLWRQRGRAPNRLVGVGFASQGWDQRSPGYRVTEAGRSAEVAFIFEGVDMDGIIGDYGRVMGGAAGYEVDRTDVALGTPADAVVVATSTGHSDRYQVTVEDVMMTTPALGGTVDDRVRADMTYFRTPRGGSVFSVGSLGFSGSLPDRGCDNDCARIVSNVIREFLTRRCSVGSAKQPQLISGEWQT